MRRKVIAPALIGIAALTLAGCSGGGDTAEPSQAPIPSASPSPTLQEGQVSEQPDEPLKIVVGNTYSEYGVISKTKVRIKNTTSQPITTTIAFSAESKDGKKQYASTAALVQNLQPKQSKLDELTWPEALPEKVWIRYEVGQQAFS